MFGAPNVFKLKEKGDVAGLAKALRHRDAGIRKQAATFLGEIGDRRAVEPLAAALGDDSHRVREFAAFALGDVGGPGAVEPLATALQDVSENVRSAAASSLEACGDERAVPALVAALGDEDSHVARQAMAALAQLDESFRDKRLGDDDSFSRGQLMDKVSAETLHPGAAVRVWNNLPGMHRWVPGWWREVVAIEGEDVRLRDLESGEEEQRTRDDLLRNAWLHPSPERVQALATKRAAVRDEHIAGLRAKYASLDFTNATEDELRRFLVAELGWRQAHDSEYSDLKDEFDAREAGISKVVQELNRRGGLELMQEMHRSLGLDAGSLRSLDVCWSGVGAWLG
jgi:hypothetical protein